MVSIFTKIIRKEIPSYKIHENEDFYAFLDIYPNVIGHTLVIPKKEVDKLFDLEDELYVGLMLYAKKIATAIEQVVDCKRVGMSVVGLDVPHAHVHLIPINEVADISFQSRLKPTEEEFKQTAKLIASAFNKL